ncbi:MAG: hypothetical protein KGJ60_10425 [Verrucomicrobiota bacterium]|nr:hypothetical protein [Verrucomicrobiota bacterium]
MSNGNVYGWSIQLAGIYTLGAPVGWYDGTGGYTGPVQSKTNACWVVDFYNGTSQNTPSLEFDVAMNEPTPQWFHLALTYDGTNAFFYTNGVLAATTLPGLAASTNEVFAPGASGGFPTSANGDYEFTGVPGYVPDTNNPIVIGNINFHASLSNLGYPQDNAIGFNCQNFNGVMDELAIYTNALPAAAILKHYQDATAANTTLYTNDVLSAAPAVYLRLDEPAYTSDPVTNFTGFPTVASYGSLSGLDGYQVNVLPGIAGPQMPGFGSQSHGILCNGMDAAVDVGNGGQLAGTALDPTNHQPFTAVCWFRGNPADIYGRFLTILGRGDSSWRFDMDGSGDIHWNPGNGPEITTPQSYNDGAWHQAVGVSDGTNAYLYLDGQLSVSGGGVGSMGGAPLDLLIGGAPDYTAGSGNRYFSGQIAQVAFFTNAFTAAQAAALYYDATTLSPVITQDPQPQAISFGGSALFGVTSSGQPVAYQWYQGTTKLNDVAGNVSGSTSPTLTIRDHRQSRELLCGGDK